MGSANAQTGFQLGGEATDGDGATGRGFNVRIPGRHGASAWMNAAMQALLRHMAC
jgi:hypothetical protein